jgi:hypothetical protein
MSSQNTELDSKFVYLNERIRDMTTSIESELKEIHDENVAIKTLSDSNQVDINYLDSLPTYSKAELNSNIGTKSLNMQKIINSNVRTTDVYTTSEMDSVFAPLTGIEDLYTTSETYTTSQMTQGFLQKNNHYLKSETDPFFDFPESTSVTVFADIVPDTSSQSIGGTGNQFSDAYLSGSVNLGTSEIKKNATANLPEVASLALGPDLSLDVSISNGNKDFCVANESILIKVREMYQLATQQATTISTLSTQIGAVPPSSALLKLPFSNNLQDLSPRQMHGSGNITYATDTVTLITGDTRSINSAVLDDSTGITLDHTRFNFLALTQGFTVSFWAKIQGSVDQNILEVSSSIANLRIRCKYGNVLEIKALSEIVLSSTNFFVPGTWAYYTIRGTASSDGTVLVFTLYRNNVPFTVLKVKSIPHGQVNNFSAISNVATSFKLFEYSGGVSHTNRVGEFTIFNRPLTDDQITELYAAGFPSLHNRGNITVTVGSSTSFDVVVLGINPGPSTTNVYNTTSGLVYNTTNNSKELTYKKDADNINWFYDASISTTNTVDSISVSINGVGNIYATSSTSLLKASVYILLTTQGSWSQLGSDITQSGVSNFGLRCAINELGDIIAISSSVGSVYVYKYASGAWGNIGVIQTGGASGRDLKLNSGGNIVAIADSTTSSNSGSVLIYENTFINNTWVQKGATFSGVSNEKLGEKISINGMGDIVAITAFGDSAGFGGVKAYKFSETSGTWVLLGSVLKATISGEKFGVSCSLNGSGDKLAIGTSYHTNNYGKVYFFALQNSVWTALGNPLIGTDTQHNVGKDVMLNGYGNILLASRGNYPDAFQELYYYSPYHFAWFKMTTDTNVSKLGSLNMIGDRYVASYGPPYNASSFVRVITKPFLVDSSVSDVALTQFIVPSNVTENSATAIQVGQSMANIMGIGAMNRKGDVIAGFGWTNSSPGMRYVRVYKYNNTSKLWERYGSASVSHEIPLYLELNGSLQAGTIEFQRPDLKLNYDGNILIVCQTHLKTIRTYKYNASTTIWNSGGDLINWGVSSIQSFGPFDVNNMGNIMSVYYSATSTTSTYVKVYRQNSQGTSWSEIVSSSISPPISNYTSYGYRHSMSDDGLTIAIPGGLMSTNSNQYAIDIFKFSHVANNSSLGFRSSKVLPLSTSLGTNVFSNLIRLNSKGNIILGVGGWGYGTLGNSGTQNNSIGNRDYSIQVFKYNGTTWELMGQVIYKQYAISDLEINSEGNIFAFSYNVTTTTRTFEIYHYNESQNLWIKLKEINHSYASPGLFLNAKGSRLLIQGATILYGNNDNPGRVYDITF